MVCALQKCSNVTRKAKKGEVIALVGAASSGKSLFFAAHHKVEKEYGTVLYFLTPRRPVLTRRYFFRTMPRRYKRSSLTALVKKAKFKGHFYTLLHAKILIDFSN